MAIMAGRIIRAVKGPNLSPPVPSKRIVTTPTGQFTIDETGKRNAVINSDEAIWRVENNQG